MELKQDFQNARVFLKKVVRWLVGKTLTPEQIFRAKEAFFANDLNRLASLYKTDKWNVHWYTQHYQRHFQPIRKKKLNILEIGVGGYENPTTGGESLHMWAAYFPNSFVYSIDIYKKELNLGPRVKIFQGSQTDERFLKGLYDRMGSLDIVIDDGSHISQDVIQTFRQLFPLLKEGGGIRY